ncbi:hypothetical protein SNE25_10240 [Mucilaginibacter sabulilitoris]|uniref:Uncharacterized protein n=1 Tax=Mucilaginibacter sabulilitoris TaxID=1173583 RepID=A0ABZ0TSE8_9SPHI|nr:hypothetical protein [Mucilaginibacter sabulilitoris]WPU95896.1 hypothetical protein SNE25_10240 [Mucilaginibacter sabulilitoris]
MKKIIFSLILILFTATAFAQKFKPVKLDSLVTVSLPDNVQKKDTLGQQIYSANGSVGFMIVIRAANPKTNTPLNKEKDLNNVLKTYIEGIQKQSGNGSVMNPRDTLIGKLEAKVFTLRVDNTGSTGEPIQLRHFILLYTQEATYTFQYYYEEQRKDLVKGELKTFTSSIKLAPDLKRNDQYISNAKGLSTPAKIGIYGGGAVIIIIIIIAVTRRKKKQ